MPPAFWQASTRYERSRVRPWMGLRNSIGVALALAIGVLVGNPTGGLIAASGALNVAVADGTDPYRHRARRMLLASLLTGLAVLAGGASSRDHDWAVLAAAFGAFVAGMMVAVNTAATDIGVITLVTLVIYSAQDLSVGKALASSLAALGGGLLQTTISLSIWPLRGRTPERRVLADFYQELARTAASPTPATEAPGASRQSTQAQQELAALAGDRGIESERYLVLLSQAERIRLTLLTLARLRIRVGREPDTAPQTAILDRCAAQASTILACISDSLRQWDKAPACPAATVDALSELADHLRHSAGPTTRPAAAVMLHDSRFHVDALAGQLRTALDLASHTTPVGVAEFEQRQAAQPWTLRLGGALASLHANLRLPSSAFRHALRLSVCVGIGTVVARGLSARRPYWIPMTIALVLKPDYTSTFSRGVLRVAGTLIGLLLSSAIFHVLAPPIALQVAFIAVFAFLLRAYGPANYGIVAVTITGLVVFMFAATGVRPGEVIVARGLNTFVGGALALLAYRLWPTWERTQVPDALARMLDAYREYFQAVRDSYLHPETSLAPELDRTRLAARLARSDIEASVGRFLIEPGTLPARATVIEAILADSHRFIHAVMSLEAGLLTSGAVPARAAFRTFANDVDLTLYFLASALRGSAIAPADLPDLREDHHALVSSGDSRVQRYALVNVETDRITNSLNTLSGETFRWLGADQSQPVST
jgi:uncharacterized membrane protein YccC